MTDKPSTAYEFDGSRWNDDYCPGDCESKRRITHLEQQLKEVCEHGRLSCDTVKSNLRAQLAETQQFLDASRRSGLAFDKGQETKIKSLRAQLAKAEAVVEAVTARCDWTVLDHAKQAIKLADMVSAVELILPPKGTIFTAAQAGKWGALRTAYDATKTNPKETDHE